MWFFLKRREKETSPQTFPDPAETPRVLSGEAMADFSFLATEDVALKFWLPEPVERALEDMASFYRVSVSLVVRMLLVDYVYGRYALAYMQENESGIFQRKKAAPLFSRRPPQPGTCQVYKVPELGKNIAPVKVWIAQRLRDDLVILADHADVLLSRFVREIIVGAVLGRGTLPERPELRAISGTTASAAWEQGEEVPMREVELNEIRALTDYEVETISEDGAPETQDA